MSSLIAIVPEAIGANCAYGGSKATSGPDSNANGVLDPAEVTSTAYVCNGPPGPGLTWVDVTGTSAQALPNTGYVANNAARVTVALAGVGLAGRRRCGACHRRRRGRLDAGAERRANGGDEESAGV